MADTIIAAPSLGPMLTSNSLKPGLCLVLMRWWCVKWWCMKWKKEMI